jgi:hypothetical protein
MNNHMFLPLAMDSSKTIIEQLYPQVYLYAYPGKFAVLDLDQKSVWYVLTFEQKNILSESCISGIFVWRNKSVTRTDGLAKRIFFKNLLPIADYAVTQEQPSGYGKAFWELRIAEAFGQGLPVYLWNLEDTSKRQIEAYDEFLDLGNAWWSKAPHQSHLKIAIRSATSE